MDTKTIFVIGANGIGKTTTHFHLKNILPPDKFCVHDFDERGVPDNVDSSWRQSETAHWISIAHQNKLEGKSTVICGFAIPDEIDRLSQEKPYVVLLHGDSITITRRLKSRHHDQESIDSLFRKSGKTLEKFISDNIYCSDILLKSCNRYGHPVVIASYKQPFVVAHEVSSLIVSECTLTLQLSNAYHDR